MQDQYNPEAWLVFPVNESPPPTYICVGVCPSPSPSPSPCIQPLDPRPSGMVYCCLPNVCGCQIKLNEQACKDAGGIVLEDVPLDYAYKLDDLEVDNNTTMVGGHERPKHIYSKDILNAKTYQEWEAAILAAPVIDWDNFPHVSSFRVKENVRSLQFTDFISGPNCRRWIHEGRFIFYNDQIKFFIVISLEKSFRRPWILPIEIVDHKDGGECGFNKGSNLYDECESLYAMPPKSTTINISHNEYVGDTRIDCIRIDYGSEIINIPTGLNLPVLVEIEGSCDDALVVNGEILEGGMIEYKGPYGCPVWTGPWEFELHPNPSSSPNPNGNFFILAAADLVGVNAGYDLSITMTEIPPTSSPGPC